MAAYQEAREAANKAPADTLDRLAQDWRASPEWKAPAPDTRKQWAYKLDAIQAKFGDAELEAFEDRGMRAEVMKWRNSMAANPRKADMHMQVLRALLKHGRDCGKLSLNIAEGIPTLYKTGQRAHIIWTPADRAAFAAVARKDVAQAVEFACLTGLRRADLIAVPWEAVGRQHIAWRTSKSGRRALVTVPRYPALDKLLDAIGQGAGSILKDERGKAWGRDNLSHLVAHYRQEAGLGDLHLHDCRGTAVTEMAPHMTVKQIADMFGWSEASVSAIRAGAGDTPILQPISAEEFCKINRSRLHAEDCLRDVVGHALRESLHNLGQRLYRAHGSMKAVHDGVDKLVCGFEEYADTHLADQLIDRAFNGIGDGDDRWVA